MHQIQIISLSTQPKIIISLDAHPAVKYAAQEFQCFIQKMVGVKLEIQTECTNDEDYFIFLGASDYLDLVLISNEIEISFSEAELGQEGSCYSKCSTQRRILP